jgi:hypothetical protein
MVGLVISPAPQQRSEPISSRAVPHVTYPVPGGNPLIVVSEQEVREWLRGLADAAGFSDRATHAFQLSVTTEFYAPKYHHEAPQLCIMVSGIPGSRTPNDRAEAPKII